jgi:hypothetical protein
MKEVRSRTKFVIFDRSTGEWELNLTENQLIREYLSKEVCIYHVWEKIEGTKKEIDALCRKYPVVFTDEMTIRPEETNNVPF